MGSYLWVESISANIRSLVHSKQLVISCVCACVCVTRTLIHGDKKAGFSVFWADDGLDTGPILLQRECAVEPNDTVDTLYNRFLFPEGIKAMVTNHLDLHVRAKEGSVSCDRVFGASGGVGAAHR